MSSSAGKLSVKLSESKMESCEQNAGRYFLQLFNDTGW
jgi:hypothetical protein